MQAMCEARPEPKAGGRSGGRPAEGAPTWAAQYGGGGADVGGHWEGAGGGPTPASSAQPHARGPLSSGRASPSSSALSASSAPPSASAPLFPPTGYRYLFDQSLEAIGCLLAECLAPAAQQRRGCGLAAAAAALPPVAPAAAAGRSVRGATGGGTPPEGGPATGAGQGGQGAGAPAVAGRAGGSLIAEAGGGAGGAAREGGPLRRGLRRFEAPVSAGGPPLTADTAAGLGAGDW